MVLCIYDDIAIAHYLDLIIIIFAHLPHLFLDELHVFLTCSVGILKVAAEIVFELLSVGFIVSRIFSNRDLCR